MHATTLIELAVQHLDRKSVRALAERMDIAHGVLYEWKNGTKPLPDDRIRQIARIANQDPGPWLLMIKSEQDEGELGRVWAKLAKQLGATAVLIVLCAMPLQAFASTAMGYVEHFPGLSIMLNRWRTWAATRAGRMVIAA